MIELLFELFLVSFWIIAAILTDWFTRPIETVFQRDWSWYGKIVHQVEKIEKEEKQDKDETKKEILKEVPKELKKESSTKKWVVEDPKDKIKKPDVVTKKEFDESSIEKPTLSFSERKKLVEQRVSNASLNKNPFQKPVLAKKVPKVVLPSFTEKDVLEKMIAYEKDFLARIESIEKVFLPYFKTKAPNNDVLQLYDVSQRMCLNLIDLKGPHLRILQKLEASELEFFILDTNETNSFLKYLRALKGLRLFFQMAVQNNQILKEFVNTFNKLGKTKIPFEELTTLPAFELQKYIHFYQDWALVREKDAEKINQAITTVKSFIESNRSLIEDLYQQEKTFLVQNILNIKEINQISYTGTNRPCKANVFIYDGILEYHKTNLSNKCQVFVFDKLFIIHEVELNGAKNEFYPILQGEFTVESLEGLKILVRFDEETKKTFSTQNEEEKGRWMKYLLKASGQTLEGEKDLIRELRLQTESIDSPQSYYIGDLSKCPLFQELPNSKETVEYSEDSNDVKCATFDKLIELLTPANNFDNIYLYTFLLTYRNFTTPLDVLNQIQQRYNIRPNLPISDKEFQNFKTEILLPIRLRIVQVLRLWIIKHGRDFRNNNEVLDKLKSFIEEMKKTKIGIGADQLLQAIKKYVEKRDTFEEQKLNSKNQNVTDSNQKPPKPVLPKTLSNLKEGSNEFSSKALNLDIIDWPPVEVARQLCVIEFSLFERIQAKECLNQSWNKDNRETKAPNIFKMIARTNNFVNWITNEILKYEKVNQRAAAIEMWIKVAEECKNLFNFNSMMAVLGALNSIGIKRLEKSWSHVSSSNKQIVAELNEVISRKKSYGELRQATKVARPPLLPYIGLYLTDLTFIEDANKNTLNDKINFFKCRKLAKVIREIQNFQQFPYTFTVVDELINKLKMCESFKLTEDELIEISYKREAKSD